jgi:hypothetical protein
MCLQYWMAWACTCCAYFKVIVFLHLKSAKPNQQICQWTTITPHGAILSAPSSACDSRFRQVPPNSIIICYIVYTSYFSGSTYICIPGPSTCCGQKYQLEARCKCSQDVSESRQYKDRFLTPSARFPTGCRWNFCRDGDYTSQY